MKLKKEYIILAVLVIGLCLYLFLKKTDRTHYQMPVIPDIDGKNISRIEITSPENTVFLTKTDDKWTIGEKAYPADPEKVKRMIDDVEKMTVTALVSESKNYFRYDLNDEKKISIKMWSGKELSRSFDMGKTAPTYQHTFIRLSDNPNVYHARGNFRNSFDLTIDEVRDKTALSFDPSIIWKIGITKADQKMIATQKSIPAGEKDNQQPAKPDSQTGKEETVWETADGKSLDKSKIKRLLDSLSKLKCRAYITDREKNDFKDPIWAVSLEGLGKHSLSIFPKDSEDVETHPAVSSGNDYPFELSAYTTKNLTSVMEELLKAAADKEPETKEAEPSQAVEKKR